MQNLEEYQHLSVMLEQNWLNITKSKRQLSTLNIVFLPSVISLYVACMLSKGSMFYKNMR